MVIAFSRSGISNSPPPKSVGSISVLEKLRLVTRLVSNLGNAMPDLFVAL